LLSAGVVVMRGLLVILVLALVPVALFAAPIPKKLKHRSTVELLIGNWTLTSKNAGYKFTIEYKRDGELEFRRVFNNNRKTTSFGSYTFDEPNKENPLGSITWKVKEGGGLERGETSKITKLTDTHLTFVDPEGLVEEFERE
jgi:uncharacterized protein (TIGR03066 family)